MGREIRRIPVGFQHPLHWPQRLKSVPMEGRVVRAVPEPAPMFDCTLAEAQAQWDEEAARVQADGTLEETWDEQKLARCRERLARAEAAPEGSLDRISIRQDREHLEFAEEHLGERVWQSVEDYCGRRPGEWDDAVLYAPADWPPAEERGYQLFETVSEGTPITPCFATQEELVD